MTASYHETEAKSITRLPGATDPWFLGRYGMNRYRGCEHGCVYCDGRAERYYVAGEFDRDIQVKRNALEVLRRELGRAGWAIQGWARERLARTRRRGAYRIVEGELAELVREGRLGALLGLPAPVVKAVEEILERLRATPASPAASAPLREPAP